MSQASKQLREYLEATYPGVRISRKSCRDTVGGFISQHSAYGYKEYDSNAMDIMGGPLEWTREQNIELIQTIVDEVNQFRDEWSIRLILRQVQDHYGHAHIDFWPTCLTRKWCGDIAVTPAWAFSDGSMLVTKTPPPENGPYDGDDMSYTKFRTDEFNLWSDDNIMEAYDAGMFEDTNRAGFQKYWVTERHNRTDDEKARFMTDYYAHLWKRGI